ncbi:senescence-induced receptor-like serine/threonine-protein kinase [Zingiber officinale]|uniref:senescence-induced receptor-like serine/threonine-protein kinase n=1 Tax=Zingiber officinale TaxID=94328 RepID=UPI001C4BD65D|nr:senescence-induced receptor-like serine/threonine-protein kinase [Zingiber officinale]
MQIAAYPSSSTTLQLSLAPDPGDLTEFYTVLYFCELQLNASRQFLIYLNGALLNDGRPLAPTYLLSDVVFNADPSLGFGECNITLVETGSSMLPPIINAIEVFTAMRNANVATNGQDVDAMLAIKGWYQVRRNWMGDPCSPQAYTWVGLNCTQNNSGVPMITAVNMSYSGLAGVITASFANLSALQYFQFTSPPSGLLVPTEILYEDVTDKVCKMIIDSGSCENIVFEEVVHKLQLKTDSHPKPYKLSWLSKGR